MILEEVHFSKMDEYHKTSAEKLIRAHEAISTCAKISNITVRNMNTSTWRSMVGSRHLGTDERLICEYTANLFPAVKDQLLVTKKRGEGYIYKHNYAESLLMAYCCQIIYQKAIAYAKINRTSTNRERPATHKQIPID